MDQWRERVSTWRPSNLGVWPTLRDLWPWFAALVIIMMVAIPWGIRAEERSLEEASRTALADAGILVEDVSFTGRHATIVADLSTDQQNEAVNTLHAMGGVSGVTWEEGSGLFVATPVTTSTTTTTTAVPEPGAELTATIKEGRITLRGIVPTAASIKAVNDAAADVWGSRVTNQLFVDAAVIAHPWLATADEAIAALTPLIEPQLTLDRDGATITGGAVDAANREAAIDRLAAALGPDVAIVNKVMVTPLDLPNFEILVPGDGTAMLEGAVANLDVRRSIVLALLATTDELAVTNQIRLSETTADLYLARRVPEVVTALGAADQWTLRFDGLSLGGTATGGKAFNGDRVAPTIAVRDLVNILGAFLQADPQLTIEIEIHAEPRDGETDSIELAQQRAEAIAAFLVRQGIDPGRVSAGNGAGEGELLRFQLIPADQ